MIPTYGRKDTLRNRQTDTAAKLLLLRYKANYQYIVEAKLTLVVDFERIIFP